MPGAPGIRQCSLAAQPPRDLAPAAIPASLPTGALVEPQAVSITAADGMRIPGQLFRPSSALASGQKRPALIFFHGGSRRQMLLGWNYRSYYHNAYAFNQFMASRGYVVLSVNYRSGIGYGLDFREALAYGASGASEFNDVLGAGQFLRAQPDVDPARIGLWGGSYGGYLTAMGLARASHMFAAGVDVHGVHDWNNTIRNFMPGYNAERRPEIARLAASSSPMAFLDGWRSPVLLIHGDDDRNVPFGESVELVEQLRARDVHVEQLVFPDEIHGFLLHRSWTRAFTAAASFLDRHLKRAEPPPSNRWPGVCNRPDVPGCRARKENSVTRHSIWAGVLAVALAGPAWAQEQATVVKRDGSRVSGRFEAWNRNTNTLYIRVSAGDQQVIPLGNAAVIDAEGNGTSLPPTETGPASGPDHVLILKTGDVIRGRLTNIEGGEGSGEENQPRMVTFKPNDAGERQVPFKDVRRIYLGSFPSSLSESPAAAAPPAPEQPQAAQVPSRRQVR